MKNAEYAPTYLLCRILEKCVAGVADFVAENIEIVGTDQNCMYLYIADAVQAEVFHSNYEKAFMETIVKTIDQYDVVVLDDKGYLKRKIGEAIDCIKITPKALKATEKLMSVNLMAWEILELAWETILKSRACLMDVSSPCFSWGGRGCT